MSSLKLGHEVTCLGDVYRVEQYVDLNYFMGRRKSDGELVRLEIKDVLSDLEAQHTNDTLEFETEGSKAQKLSDSDIETATSRADVLEKLLETKIYTKADVKRIADELKKHPATIYRWIKKVQEKGPLSLAPAHPTGGRGKARIDPLADDIVCEVIHEFYMTKQKRRISKIMTDVEIRCRRANLKVPHENTVRLRVAQISRLAKLKAREGNEALEKFEPRSERFKGADFPNAIWQIDHTPLDICVVDEEFRRNIGRPWLTLVIDVYSRCIVGFYLSLDAPNETSVGMALIHAILPKEGWLTAHGLDLNWPNWGMPITVHADNDSTFRCKTLTKSAIANKFNIEWRAVKKPHWGAHIERLLGIVNLQIHTLPGTTFSNPTKRGNYKSHKEAVFTYPEIETYLTKFICNIYHQKYHSKIRRTPIRKYEIGLLGDGAIAGVGLPEPINDPKRLRLDFLSFSEKTVQQYGIAWDSITYYDAPLRKWIGAIDPDKPKNKRKFLVRRDKRDLSHIWFLDPNTDRYFKIPYRNPEFPGLDYWQLKHVRAHLKAIGRSEVDETLIFSTHLELQQMEKQAVQSTQKARTKKAKQQTRKDKARTENAQVDEAEKKFNPGRGKEKRVMSTFVDESTVEPFKIFKK